MFSVECLGFRVKPGKVCGVNLELDRRLLFRERLEEPFQQLRCGAARFVSPFVKRC